MLCKLKKLSFLLIFNITLFLILMIGIQNSSKMKQVNFISGESIALPVGFIIGISFILGTLTGGLITTNFDNKLK